MVGQHLTLDDAYAQACRCGDLAEADQVRLAAAMADFSATLVRWRNAHYRLAVRMLGDTSGTGYTEGTPYLAAVRDIPVFATVDATGRINSDETTGCLGST
jgi:tryptophan 2,3-dioxygenase